MNSDVTMLFLDVLPRLPAGVIVQVHDITLPCDYPAQWTGRYYSEQYLLAAYLLGRGDALEIVLPCAFASDDPELHGILAPIWSAEWMEGAERWRRLVLVSDLNHPLPDGRRGPRRRKFHPGLDKEMNRSACYPDSPG
jgi:hypothetical protein